MEKQQPATVHTTISSSGITHVPLSIPMSTTHINYIFTNANATNGFSIFTHAHTPLTHSTTLSHIPPPPVATAPMRNTSIHIPKFFPSPTTFTTIQNYNIHMFPQFTYTQIQQHHPLPLFRTSNLELAMFDGSNPLEWLF